MDIAIVGDLHGHFHLMFATLGRWQRESGRRLSLILQVGDLGVFLPDRSLDHATKRFAARDPEELGFADFAGDRPPATLLDPRPPLIFIPGNHEDFDILEAARSKVPDDSPTYPVSADGRLQALRSGRVATVTDRGASIRIGGVAGAANLQQKASRDARCHLPEADALALAALGRRSFDVLLTHDGPDGLWPDSARGLRGSPALRVVIEEVSPAFAFFGHHNLGGTWTIGRTEVVALSDCGYDHVRDWRIDRDGIGVLSWTETPSFERMAPDWLTASTRHTWRHWGLPDR